MANPSLKAKIEAAKSALEEDQKTISQLMTRQEKSLAAIQLKKVLLE